MAKDMFTAILRIGVLNSYFKDRTLGLPSRYGNHNPYLPDTTHAELHSSKVSAIALLTGIDAIGAHVHRLHVTLDQNMGISDQLLSARVHNLEREICGCVIVGGLGTIWSVTR